MAVTYDGELQTLNGITASNKTYYGKSTDSKPTAGIGNGSVYIEMDTGKAYFYDAAASAWLEPGA